MIAKKKSAWIAVLALFLPIAFSFAAASPAQAAGLSTSLTTFTVDGQNALNQNQINLDVSAIADSNGNLSVDVLAVAESADTTVTVAGATNLVVGDNTLTVTVEETADPTSKTVYTRTLKVLSNDNRSTILVNQEELVNGEMIEVDWGTTSVPVRVTPFSSSATVKVNGTDIAVVAGVASTTVTGLQTGDNLIDIFVTAENGEIDESQLTVYVNQNTDTSATFTVDGIRVEDGDTVPLDFGTTDPEILVQTADENAVVEIVGGTDLIVGENPVEIYVTAEDGVTYQKYTFVLVVLADDDATATITVNGSVRDDGDTIELPYGTSSVAVSVVTNDPDASYEITGGTNLLQGDNDLIITVYAPDNVTTIQYALTLTVIDPDVTLKTLKVNGTSVADNGSIISGTLENTLVIETTDPLAKVAVDGGAYNPLTGKITLEPGSNDLTITVTGQDNATTRDYTITVGVWAIDVEWEGLSDPVSVVQSSTVSIVPGSVNEIQVTATAPLAGWTGVVEGTTGLAFGANTVTVTFEGPSNEIQVTFTVFIGDADLSFDELTINDNDVTLNGLNGTVTLDPHTLSADIVATAKDERSTVVVSGGTNLITGNNSVTVVVTGADGKSATYSINVIVAASENADIDAVTLNGAALPDEDLIEVNAGTLDVQVDTADEAATATISISSTSGTFGGWTRNVGGITTGSGYLTITVEVTAEDGVTKNEVTYNILASKDLDVVSGSNPESEILRVGTLVRATRSTVAALYPSGTNITYSWLADGETLGESTGSRYLLTAEDLDREIRPVVSGVVSGVRVFYVGQPLTVYKGIIALSSVPKISGTARVTQSITAKSGVWSKDVELAYQWKRNGLNIDGATSETLVLEAGDFAAGDLISVSVTGTLDGYETLTKQSSSVTVLAGVLKITEKPEATAQSGYFTGTKITVTNGSVNYADADVDFAWYRNGVLIPTEQSSSYDSSLLDVGKRLAVRVTYSGYGFLPVSITLKLPIIKLATLDAPDAATISLSQDGKSLVAIGGYDLVAETSSVKYTWYRNGKIIVRAKGASYLLSSADAGTTISVRVVASYLGYLSTNTVTTGDDNFQVDN